MYSVGLASPVAQTTEAERQALISYANGKNKLAEIGVSHGVSTRMLREVMASDGLLIAIDPYYRGLFGLRGNGWARLIAHREVSKVKNGTVLWVEQTGKAAPSLDNVRKLLPVDFLFIDGDHSWQGLQADWTSWSGNVSVGGIVALHDSVNRGGNGSERYTTQVILSDQRYVRIETVDSLTILKRVA